MKIFILMLVSASAFAQGGALYFEKATDVSAGTSHSCVVADGKVQCWGSNEFGQLDVPELVKPRQVIAMDKYSCALDANGIKCWGINKLDHNGMDSMGVWAPPPTGKNIERLIAGRDTACAVIDSSLYCWARGGHQPYLPMIKRAKLTGVGLHHVCTLDQEAVKCFHDSKGPLSVPQMKNVTALVSGDNHACVISEGSVKCWKPEQGFFYKDVPAIKNPRALTARGDHTCAIGDEGVQCWGANEFGQSNVPPLTNPRLVTTGGTHACAVADEGTKCWGNNDQVQTRAPALKNPTEINASRNRTCAADDGELVCWGSTSREQMEAYNLLKRQGRASGLRNIVQDAESICYILELKDQFDGSIKTVFHCGGRGAAWREDGVASAVRSDTIGCTTDKKEILDCRPIKGYPSESFPLPPQPPLTSGAISAGQPLLHYRNGVYAYSLSKYYQIWNPQGRGEDKGLALDVAGGDYGVCVLTSKGKVECFDVHGNGSHIAAEKAGRGLAVGSAHGCAIREDKSVVCWGRSNDFSQQNAPATSSASAISSLTNHSCLIDKEGVKCWGANEAAQSEVPGQFLLKEPSVAEPGFNLDQLPQYLQVAGQVSPEYRGRVFREAADLLSVIDSKDRSAEAFQSRYLVVKLLSAALMAGDSPYAQSKFNPTLAANVAGFEKKLGLTGERGVVHSPRNIVLALSVAKAGIAVATDFLPMNERETLQNVLRAIGQASAAPSDSAKVSAAAAALDAIEPDLRKISVSGKGAFLAQLIPGVSAWLKGAP